MFTKKSRQAGGTWWMAAAVIATAIPLAACTRAGADAVAGTQAIRPATVEQISGTDFKRVTLTAESAQRMRIGTSTVQAATDAAAKGHTIVPYAAVLYDATGGTWVYTSPEPFVFVRHRIVIESIENGTTVLSDGPPTGTAIVTDGASLLFGTEFEIGN